MPSTHQMIELTRYVGGEDGWICEGEIKASHPSVSAETIRREMRAILPDTAYMYDMARMYARNGREYRREIAAQERWEARRARYLMLCLRRKGA
jgi:hypothetical protein